MPKRDDVVWWRRGTIGKVVPNGKRPTAPVRPSLCMSAGPKAGSAFSHEPRHQFDMRGVAELVDRCHALDPVAAIDQDPGVACKSCDVAGYCNQYWNFAGRELKGLRLGPLPRRIEHDRVIVA